MRTQQFGEMIVSIGDRVFFRYADQLFTECHPEKYSPAIVTFIYDLSDDVVDLVVFSRTKSFHKTAIPYWNRRTVDEAWVEELPEE